MVLWGILAWVMVHGMHPTVFMYLCWDRLMSDYRRVYMENGMYFFTVVTYRWQKILCNVDMLGAIRLVIESVRESYPFMIEAWVMLPDYLHCLWQLPENDTDYSRAGR